MSTLAQQLQRLAVPQTSNLTLHDKERKSLLFDPKEAASLDKETFYALGINGLEELSAIQPTFREFESSLFNENSQNFQRSVQTKEVNERLNETISEFLLQLSPYFLLKPAHKTLEWLIYRYQIHVYNMNDVMLCILPYHESKIFVRVLQLLKLDSKTRTMWDWLQPIQESGVYLPRSTLINHCGTNPAFLAFISEMVPKYITAHTVNDEILVKQLRVVFSFYTTTIVGVLENRPITEKIVSGLIPYLTRGLKSSTEEYKAASYMICGQMFYKAQLQEKLLVTLQNTISKYLLPSLLTEGIICILVMFQSQDNINKLSKKSFKYLSRQNRLVSVLEQLAITHNIDALLKPLLLKLITAGVKQAMTGVVTMDTSDDEGSGGPPSYLATIREIMSRLTLNNNIATEMASSILESYIEHGSDLDPNDPSGESINLNMKTIVSSLETKYPDALDAAIAEMRGRVEDTDQQESVDYFLQQSVVSVKRQIVPDMDTNLFLCLNHRSEMVRIRSVQHLLRNKDQCNDDNFLCDSLLARMVDDSPNVVKTVFKNCKDLESVISDKQQLTTNLLQVFKTHTDKDIIQDALTTMVAINDSDVHIRGPVLLSYLCCLDKQDFSLDFLEKLLNSPLARDYLPLSQLKSKWLTPLKKTKNISTVAMNIQLAQVVGETIVDSNKDFRSIITSIYEQIDVSPCPQRLLFILNLVLLRLVQSKKHADVVTRSSLLLSHFLEKVFCQKEDKTTEYGWNSIEDMIQKSLTCLTQGQCLPWCFYLCLLSQLVDHINIPRTFKDSIFWQFRNDSSTDDDWLKLIIKLMDILLEQVANSDIKKQSQELLMKLIQTKFPDSSNRFRLFGLIWTEHVNNYSQELGLTAVLQARVLQLGQMYMRSLQTIVSPTPVIINLLSVCNSSHSTLREVAAASLNIMVHILPDMEAASRLFLRNLLNTEEEIINDPSYLCQCFRSVYENKVITCTPKKKRRSAVDNDKDFSTILLEVAIDEATPSFVTKSILSMMSDIDNVECFCESLPLLERYLSNKYTTATAIEMDCLSLLFDRYTPNVAGSLNCKTKELELLVEAICMSRKPNNTRPMIQELAIPKINKEFYSCLPSLESKQVILKSLITAWLHSTSVSTSNMVKRNLKHMNLDADNIIVELSPVLQTTNVNSVRESKRLRKQSSPEVEKESIFDSEMWKRIVIVLEAIQEKKKIDQAPKLVPVAFQLLAKILEAEDHLSAEYIKQLTLSTLYFICSRHQDEIKESALKPEQFNLERIVQCIRTSDNPQTHHQALLVLTIAAKIQPEQLLHNVMSVFTFMGANILRQDNAYSFHVISQILENVIPVITTACEEKSKASKSPKKTKNKPEMIIGMILRIFVDAYPHIPEHRKLMLFSKLVNIVGEKQYLWHCILLFIEHVGTKNKRPADDDEDDDHKQAGPISTNDLEFILKLATSFPVVTQIKAARTMISFVASLPVEKDDGPVKEKVGRTKYTDDVITDEAKIFNISSHTAKQLRHFKYTTFYVLCQHLQFDPFLSQISSQGEEELLVHFQSLLECVLNYITQAAKTCDNTQHKPDAKFYRVLLHKVYDLLDKVVSLLPDVMFVNVITGLLEHDLPAVQRKSMELLNTKLHQLKENQHSTQIDMLLPLVDKLTKVAKTTLLDERECEDTAVNGQTALYSLKLLCRMLGSKNPKPFVEVLKVSSKVLNERIESAPICATVLLCIAELCTCLKIHIIQHLPIFLPQVIHMVSIDERLLENELLTLSFATALLCVVESLPQFLSPYLLDILIQVCRLSTFADGDNPQRPQLQVRLQLVRHLLATSLPSRVIIPCIVSCYDKLVTHDWECLVFLMLILKEHINEMKKEDLENHHNQLLLFFFNCLDFRLHYSQVGEEGVIKIEDSVIQTITSMVMKMSEASFRPMMFKVFDWATRDGIKDRTLILYRLSDHLVETLRSLFIIVAGQVVNHAAEVLDANNSSKTEDRYFGKGKINRSKQNMLLSAILDCLSKCFLYDNEGFVSKDRFDTVMSAIVDQLENLPYNGSEKPYEKRITNSLVPCIANLAVAAHDDSLWRKLNYQILLKTRHSSKTVRMATLEVVDEFHKKLGEDFMSLLPETIPFLAELMEDDSDEVEKKCQQVIIEMEKTLGEPLQKYF
ncbi:hypothetical protein SNE40_011943 [Patella caerulea]|uniref:HEAT repeat-containing protein 1 n=1 Tax=Patella caerulea TaxID=87958 RepID=A0AAN8JR52_PATCE